MSCQSCCAFDVPQIADFAAGGYYVYPTQGYSFVITTCPPGLVCQPGIFPQIVNINKNRIPVVPVPPNPQLLTLQGCQSLITATVPAGSSASVIAGIAAGMQQQFAQQQANCDLATKFNFPTINTTTTVFNTAQTASCVSPQFGTAITVPAGTVGVTLFNATTADVIAAQAAMNQLALTQAQAQLFCFNPGPDWRQLVWDAYTLVQNPPMDTASGTAAGNQTTGVLNRTSNTGFHVNISPVHAGGLTYTGPSVVCTIKRVITASSGGANIAPMNSVPLWNGGQLTVTPNAGNPIFPAPGTYLYTFTVPLSNNATLEFNDASPGNVWAGIQSGTGTGNVSFVWSVFQ